jgi:hypothetical protein
VVVFLFAGEHPHHEVMENRVLDWLKKAPTAQHHIAHYSITHRSGLPVC